MFIGISPSCISAQPAVQSQGGSNSIISTGNGGNYPATLQNGDVILLAVTSTGPITLSIDFTSVTSGSTNGINYNFAYKISDGTETGAMGNTGTSQATIALRGVDINDLVVSVVAGSAWDTLTGLVSNSNIIAIGYTEDGSGGYGGATIPAGFTTYQSSGTVVIAGKNYPEPGTSFTFTGFSNDGLNALCYSVAIA
jgi:hypothetical protein